MQRIGRRYKPRQINVCVDDECNKTWLCYIRSDNACIYIHYWIFWIAYENVNILNCLTIQKSPRGCARRHLCAGTTLNPDNKKSLRLYHRTKAFKITQIKTARTLGRTSVIYKQMSTYTSSISSESIPIYRKVSRWLAWLRIRINSGNSTPAL